MDDEYHPSFRVPCVVYDDDVMYDPVRLGGSDSERGGVDQARLFRADRWRNLMRVNAKDLVAGSFFVLAGVSFCANAYKNLTIGTAVAMGPGYFPIVLGVILGLLGLAIVIGAIGSESSPIEGFSRRGILLIGLSPIVFGVSIGPLGVVAALLLSTMVAALASRNMSLRAALILSLGLTLFCVAIFVYGLGLPLQLFSPEVRAWVN